MRRFARSSNDDLHAALVRAGGPLMHLQRLAMRASDFQLVGNAESLKLIHAGLHSGQIGFASQNNAYNSGFTLFMTISHNASPFFNRDKLPHLLSTKPLAEGGEIRFVVLAHSRTRAIDLPHARARSTHFFAVLIVPVSLR